MAGTSEADRPWTADLFNDAAGMDPERVNEIREDVMLGVAEIAGWIGLWSLPAFIVWDLVRPSRRFETPRFWRLRAAVATVVTFYVALYAGEAWGAVLGGGSLVNGAALGTWGGAAAGILLYELAHYWYHRSAHRVDWLWRKLHQMHHSAESLEALGANYAHPLDTVMFTTLAVLAFFPVLGLSPEAGAIAAAFLAFNAAFQHANIRTPRWLGYIIQRPESHGIHHERGVHAYNYSDLPLWDMVFGTFRNPETWEGELGFYNGASTRIGEMLVGRDVSEPKAVPAAAPETPVLPKAA
jgi:sterol desaturase/sphingolipid hydroxylase (fatty acid hydroxylase superfamily)